MLKNIGYWEQVLQTPTPAYKEMFDSERRYLLDHIPGGANVLDIGCGEGRNMRTIFERTKEITGVDEDERAVDDARKSFVGISTVKIIRANAAKLPFADQTFDVVTFLMILPNLDDLENIVMGEVSRVLKVGGRVILSTFSEDAFEERIKIYKQVKVPIIKVEGTTVHFDKSLGANVSKQFSKKEIQTFAERAGLTLTDIQKVGTIAYICTLEKVPE